MSQHIIQQSLSSNADLFHETEEQIAHSRRLIRSRLQRSSSDVLASRQTFKDKILAADSLLQNAVQQFDRFEQTVLPLVTAHLNELQCLVQLQQTDQQQQSESGPIHSDVTEPAISDQLVDEAVKADDVEPEFLIQGREIVCRDMGDDYPVGSEPDDGDGQSFSFPVCRVSKSCLAMLDLMLQILSDAEFDPDPSHQLVLRNTATKLMHLFLICLPVKHSVSVGRDERLAALFHNNCFFAAHSLITSPQVQESGVDCTSLISEFQSLGESAVRQWTEKNRTKIVDQFQMPAVIQCLIDSHVKGYSITPFADAVKQSLFLLQGMRSNWVDILPHNVYNTQMSGLISVILDEIIRLILMLEDLTSRAAEDIANVMSSLRRDLPQILSEPHEGIQALLPNAFQFLELERMLTSSLADIVTRWGGGFGPLSVAFRADQVKKMIRALFQNNELRATALNKIREL
jgi:centromere/kinetochore protein ZW10